MRRSVAELLIPSVCPACDVARPEGAPLLCLHCALGLERLDTLGPVATVYAYSGSALRLIRRFKFDGRRDALRVLLPGLAERARVLEADVIVPVPRHRSRVRRLGGDPVHDLARALAKALGLPLRAHVLVRTSRRPPQTALGGHERRRSPEGSFGVRGNSLAGVRVLLLDDVTTTGATLGAAARALQGARVGPTAPLALAGTALV